MSINLTIRLPAEDYLRLKHEAAKSRRSLAAVIREKIGIKKDIEKSPDKIVKTAREMRYQGK